MLNIACRNLVYEILAVSMGLTLAILLLFGHTSTFEFTLDDQNHILRNPIVVGDQNASTAFTQGTWPGNLYRPLFLLSLAFNSPSNPTNPASYHFTNIALHIIATVLLYLLLRQLCHPRVAALASLLFALHPIHVEVVANISNRSELLAHAFGLLSIYIVARLPEPISFCRNWWLLPFLLFIFLCALLSKESAFCYFALLPLCLIHQSGLRAGVDRTIFPVAAMSIAGLCYLILRHQALGGVLGTPDTFEPSLLDNPLIESPTASRIFVALALLGKYGAMSFWPWPLSSDYSFAEISGNPDPNILAYLVSVFALGVLLVDGIIKKKPTWLWPSWFFVSFLITSNVVFLTGTAFAERLVYLGSAAACVLLAMTIQGLRSKAISLAASLSIIFVFAVASWSYSLNWHSNHTLANYELVQSPKSARVQYNYGISLFTQGYSQQSEEYFEKALEIYPQYAEAAYALAQALMRRWDKKGAEKLYLGVLKLSPNHYGAILGLYGITAGQNRSKEAKAYRDRLMAIDPHNPRLQRLEHALKLAAR